MKKGESNECESFSKKEFVFNKKIKNNLGLKAPDSIQYVEKVVNSWTKIFTKKEKTETPGLIEIVYNCFNGMETDLYELKDNVKLKIYYGKSEKQIFFPTLYLKNGENYYPKKDEVYVLLKENGLLNNESNFFFYEEIKKSSSTSSKCGGDFYAFFEKFIHDSIFQKKQVSFPLKLNIYSKNVLKNKLLKASEYKFLDIGKDIDKSRKKNDTYLRKIDTLINCEFYYKKVDFKNQNTEIYKFKKGTKDWLLSEIIFQKN